MLINNRRSPPSPKADVIQTIDLIMQNHYFQSKLDEMLDKKRAHYDSKSTIGLLDDQYYKAHDDLIEEMAEIVHGVVETKLRDILTQQFINIGDQLEGMKQQMFAFMNQQANKTEDIKKQLHKLAEQAKRRASTTQALSTTSVLSTNGYTGGIRFIRSGVTSSVQSGSSSNLPVDNNNKSFHSQLMALKKQFDELKASIQSGDSVKLIQDQLNQFKIQTKVAVQALKQQGKKAAVDIASLTKLTSNNNTLTPSIKQQIDASVKRTIAAQLKVYGSYSQQILQIKQSIQQFDDKLSRISELHNQYLSNQLKSVWLVLNDMKKNLDDVIENIGLNSSRQILL